MSEIACSLCHMVLLEQEPSDSCPECGARYHAECHAENGGCGTYGCSRVPEAPKQVAAVLPPTYWGQGEKTCPACDREIRAAALRCRHCGVRFPSAAPITKEEYSRQAAQQTASQGLNRFAPWIFAGGVVPCTAPLVLCVVAPWVLSDGQARLRRARPLSRLLVCLGLGVAAVWVVLSVLVLIAR